MKERKCVAQPQSSTVRVSAHTNAHVTSLQDCVEALGQGELGPRKIGEVCDHQEVLEVRVEHALKLRRLHPGHSGNRVEDKAADVTVAGDLAVQHTLHVVFDNREQIERLVHGELEVVEVAEQVAGAVGHIARLLEEIHSDALCLVVLDLALDWHKNGAGRLVRDAEGRAGECADGHLVVGEARVDEQVHGVKRPRLARVEVVDENRVLGNLSARRIPPDDNLLRVHFLVQLKHAVVCVHINGDLIRRFVVGHGERISHLNDAVLSHRSEQRANHTLLIVIAPREMVQNGEVDDGVHVDGAREALVREKKGMLGHGHGRCAMVASCSKSQ
eukprot:Opistho-1_new@6838